MTYRLLVLSGDGIGPEVTREARRVVDWFVDRRGLDCTVQEEAIGLASLAAHGVLLRQEVLDAALAADAVLFGAGGGPGYDTIPPDVRRAGGLLRLRKELRVFANLRPVIGYEALGDIVSLKPEFVRGVDIMIVRELNGGLYFGEPRGIETLPDGSERAVDTMVYTTPEIERVLRFAFELARSRQGRVCSVDKSNVLRNGALWRKIATRIGAEEFPDVDLSHMLVDNCALQLIRDPKQFDVIVTENTFGDILSDGAGAIAGSLGMLPSAALGAPGPDGRQPALYEPVHGSAPDIAGRGIANPLAAILSVAMALRHSFARPADAALLERAVGAALAAGKRTADIAPEGGQAISTTAMADAVLAALDSLGPG